MNCKRCDYTLWNIEGRQCPECGLSFKPSDFEFSLNSVRFCCPLCRQAYYGTSNRGHLVPESFDCVACGKAITMDQMVLLPAIGVAESITRAELMPWIERAKIGRFVAWFLTLSKAISNPQRLIEITPRERPGSEAFLYAMSNLILFFFLNFSWLILPRMLVSTFLPGSTLATMGGSTSIVFGLAIMFCIVIGFLMLQSAVAHLVISVTGGSDQPQSRTLQCIAYSSGTSVLAAIPCVGVIGMPLFLIWWIVASAMMIRTAHRVSAIRAAFAASLLPLLLTLLFGLTVYYRASKAPQRMKIAGTGAIALPGTKIGSLQPAQEAGVVKISAALVSFVKDYNRYPTHGLELVEKNYLLLTDFALEGSLQEAVVAGRSLAESITLTPEELKAWTDTAASGMPDKVIAHRVGDFLFTYHGLIADSSRVDVPTFPSRWICIYMPVNAMGESPVAVIDENSSIQRVAAGDLDGVMREVENAQRAVQNGNRPALAPLRTLGGLSHDSPFMQADQ